MDISEIYSSQEWINKRCFLIGGGPSLRGFDFTLLKNEATIGINKVFEVFEPTINYSRDPQFYTYVACPRVHTDESIKRIIRWKKTKSLKVFSEVPGVNYGNDIVTVKNIEDKEISRDLSKGIHKGSNSGFGALMLAIALGATEIYLLGYDMSVSGENTHWHKGYPGFPTAKTQSMLSRFTCVYDQFAPEIKRFGITVINLCLDSKLDCFKKAEFENVFFT